MLHPCGDTGDPDFEFDEGLGVVAHGLETDEADDACLVPYVCDSLNNDLGGSCSLVDLGLAWVSFRGPLNIVQLGRVGSKTMCGIVVVAGVSLLILS